MSLSSFCSQLARSHDVSPAGTATEATHWLLIEDPSPWGEAAVEEADWFSDIRGAIRRWAEVLPDLRVQLIRKALDRWETPGQIRCFAVRVGLEPVMHEWRLRTYRDVAALDIPEVLGASPNTEAALPLLFTCVNGQRDACCAKWGRPVAEAAAEAAPTAAWQTSHLGGHRFAPTALVLPHGTQYGWLEPDDTSALIAAHRQRQLYDLGRVRGRVDCSRPVQAACLALRRRWGLHRVGAVQGAVTESTEDGWTVRVQAEGETSTAHVRRKERAVSFPHSCGSDDAKSDGEWQVTWDSKA